MSVVNPPFPCPRSCLASPWGRTETQPPSNGPAPAPSPAAGQTPQSTAGGPSTWRHQFVSTEGGKKQSRQCWCCWTVQPTAAKTIPLNCILTVIWETPAPQGFRNHNSYQLTSAICLHINNSVRDYVKCRCACMSSSRSKPSIFKSLRPIDGESSESRMP